MCKTILGDTLCTFHPRKGPRSKPRRNKIFKGKLTPELHKF